MKDEIIYCDNCGAEIENESCDCGWDIESTAGEKFQEVLEMYRNEI